MPTDPELVEEAVASLVEAWSIMVRRMPNGRIDRLDGVTFPFGDVPLPFLNLGTLDTPCADRAELRRRLETVKEHVAGESHPWMLALCEEWAPDDWREVVDEAGLHVAMAMTGMVTEQLLPPRRPAPALDLRRVSDERSRRAVADLNGMAYVLPEGMCDCVSIPEFWPDDMHGYVGSVDGEDVCTTSVFEALGTTYVALVATHPEHGRKGYAEHVMRHALEQGGAALGLKRSILHASDAGRPIYAAMGYAETSRFAVLSPEPPEAH